MWYPKRVRPAVKYFPAPDLGFRTVPRKRPPSTIEVGAPGLRHYGGRIDEEYHPKLRGGKATAIYEEMRDNDATVGAVFYTIESFLRAVDWKAEGPDEAEEEFLESCMHDMETSWEDMIGDALSFLIYGHALHEVVYKIRLGTESENPRYRSDHDDARIGWRNIALRSQRTIDRWDIDDQGNILGCWQTIPSQAGGNEVYLPMNRCVLFRTTTRKNNPEGRSILRNAYRSWYFKKRLEEIEAIGISRDLGGLPVVHVPASIMSATATAAQRATRASMETLVSQLHRDEREGVVFPSEEDGTGQKTGYKLSLLASSGQKQIPADPVIRRYDARIAMSMASEFLLLGTEKQGSYALGAEKSANFLRSLSWYIDQICTQLNKGPVKRLYDVNNVPVEKRAKIVAGEIDMPGLQELGVFIQQIAGSGLLHPTPEVENKLRAAAKLPVMPDEELQALFEEEKAAKEKEAELNAQVMQAKAQPPGAASKPKPGAPDAE